MTRSSVGLVLASLLLATVLLYSWNSDSGNAATLRQQRRGLSTPTLISDPSTVTFKDQAAQVKLSEMGQMPLYDPSESDSWKKGLFERLDRIRARCGPLCTINDRATFDQYTVGFTSTTFGRQINVPVECDAIMLDEDIDVGDPSVPFPPPKELESYYAMNGLINFDLFRKLNNVYLGGDQTSSSAWTTEMIQGYIDKAKNSNSQEMVYPPYGIDTTMLRDSLRKHTDIEGKRVLVIGTERPWVEGICLALGAAHVTTLEYGKIENHHPQITTVTPEEFRQQYRQGEINPFDIVVSFSSLEHPGLGRYGDALNPWSDLLAIARSRCVTKPGGFLALALPTDLSPGGDKVLFNDRRQYGMNRWPLITSNWVQVDQADHVAGHNNVYQPTFVFQNL